MGWGRGTAVQNIHIKKEGAGSGSENGSDETVWDGGGQESAGGCADGLRIGIIWYRL